MLFYSMSKGLLATRNREYLNSWFHNGCILLYAENGDEEGVVMLKKTDGLYDLHISWFLPGKGGGRTIEGKVPIPALVPVVRAVMNSSLDFGIHQTLKIDGHFLRDHSAEVEPLLLPAA